jgi:hypothetical protein
MAKTGMFSASRISELLSQGTGKTRQSYIYDLALDVLDCKPQISTAAMEHGINTEINAFEYAVKPLFPTAFLKSDTFVVINENLGCSTDVEFRDSKNTLDIKCPTINGFCKHRHSTIKTYYDQVQTQLLSTGGETGYLFYYLSKPITWENGDSWTDYEFENFDDNYFIKEIAKDSQRQDEILAAVETYSPVRDEMIQLLLNAKELDFKEFFALNKTTYLPSLKESNNILKEKVVRFENQFYSLKDKF